MLVKIYEIPVGYVAITAVLMAGIILKMIIGSIYKRDIRNILKIESTKKKWLNKLTDDFRYNFGGGYGNNVSLFVNSGVEGRKLLGFRLRKIDKVINRMPYLILTMSLAFSYFEVYFTKVLGETYLCMFYGVVAAMLMYTVSEMIDNEEKKEVLKLKLTNYYENELLPRLMENETSSQPELIFSKVNEGAKEQVAATLEADIKAKYQMISPQKQNAKVNGQMTAMQESGSKEKPLEDAVKILSVKAEEYVAATKEPNAEQAYNHAVGAELTDTLDSDEEPDVEEMNQKTPDYSLNQTLEEAAPKKNITDEEKRIIEEVLKEYLFK
jgi:hypothetical protein